MSLSHRAISDHFRVGADASNNRTSVQFHCSADTSSASCPK
jgi:hypothetical protein